jgi:hypothetical protein
MPPAGEGFIARVARGLGYIATGRSQDWFGPSVPMAPVAPADVAGRQFDYPVAFNLAQTPRAYEPVGFAELRALADAYDLARVIILAAIPMGVLWAFEPATADRIATGLQRWLAAIPSEVWQLFTVGYLGYTGGRSWEKVKSARK